VGSKLGTMAFSASGDIASEQALKVIMDAI
jgi:hypothetical protein